MWDGIIVGGGLAGLVAGIRAAERGKKVLLIAEGAGSLLYSSGVLNYGAVNRLAEVREHPYALVGETVVRTGLDYFRSLFPEYLGEWGEARNVLTPLGSLRQASLAPKRLDTEVLRAARRILLAVPEGMKDFQPEVARASLANVYPQASVELYPFRTKWFKAWHDAGKALTSMDYARFWRSERGVAYLQELLQTISSSALSVSEHPVAVIFPGLVSTGVRELAAVLAAFPLPVVEMTEFPPSARGYFLYEALIHKFKEFGGELLLGSGVKKAEIAGGRCRAVLVESKGHDSRLEALSFVLATGGIFGGGIKATPNGQQETVMGLPLFVPADWTRAEFLGEQPYAQMGVEADQTLRPLDPKSREVALENVRIAGRTLAHYDPWTENSAGGVALASGYLAGDLL